MSVETRSLRLSSWFPKGGLIFGVFLWFLSVNGYSGILEECQGCHSPQRQQHQGEIKFGFHKWRDHQCYGCHHELKQAINEGAESKRYWITPLNVEKKQIVDQHGLSYLQSPMMIGTCVDGIRRITEADFFSWLKHPTVHRGGEYASNQMLAFPRLNEEQRQNLKAAYFGQACGDSSEQTSSQVADARTGKNLFASKCASCHHEGHPLQLNPLRLSLYSWQWLHAYSNQERASPHGSRSMPKIAISISEAQAIKAYLQKERITALTKVDKTSKLTKRPTQNVEPLRREEAPEFWQIFFRQGHCVHCHDGDQRGTGRFQVTEAGLKTYLAKNGVQALRLRLEARQREAEVGIVGSTPGMPMTKPPLDASLMNLFERWVASSCYGVSGEKLCLEQSKKK